MTQPQPHRQHPERRRPLPCRAALAVAVDRANAQVAEVATLILGGLLVLLTGAVWTQLT